MTESVERRLATPFPSSMIGGVRKGGTTLDYIPVHEVIARLNLDLGTGNWGESDVQVWRDNANPEWVLARTTVWAIIDGQRTEKVGFGGQKIKTLRDSEDPVDLGDEFKGAHSDAFKKACQKLGVGLHLARDESAIASEHAEQARRDRAEADPASEAVVNLLLEKVASLEEDESNNLKKQWRAYGVPKLEVGNDFTVDHAALVAKWLEVELPDGEAE